MLPAIVWAVVILALSTMPVKVPSISPFWDWLPLDKMVHFGMYLLLSGLLLFGGSKQYSSSKLRSNYKSFAIITSISYGVLMELLQGFVIMDRNLEFYDIIANTAGSLTALVVFKLVYLK